MPENPSDPVDVRTIRHLVRLMKAYDLTAIDLIDGSTQIRLRRRGGEAGAAVISVPHASAIPSAHPAPPPTASAPRPEAPAPPPAPAGIVIESPMVGTFYAASSPDSPPFVTIGSAVRPDTTVCVIEAMKVFTDIPASVSGTITEILVKNGQSVEYGQPLFRVNPA